MQELRTAYAPQDDEDDEDITDEETGTNPHALWHLYYDEDQPVWDETPFPPPTVSPTLLATRTRPPRATRLRRHVRMRKTLNRVGRVHRYHDSARRRTDAATTARRRVLARIALEVLLALCLAGVLVWLGRTEPVTRLGAVGRAGANHSLGWLRRLVRGTP